MNRRRFVSTLAVGGSLSVAGCGGREDSSNTGETTESAGKNIDQATTAIRQALDVLDSESDKFAESGISDGVDVETTAITGYLDTASSELDAASENATASQRERIDALQRYVQVIRRFTTLLDVTGEGFTQLGVGLTYFESQEFERAAEKIESATQTLSEASDTLAVARDRFSSLNIDILSDMDAVQFESTQSQLSTFDNLLSALQTMSSGLRHLALGMQSFTAARDAVEADDYARAEAKFDDATNYFGTARTVFQDAEGSVPSTVQSSFVKLSCEAEALDDASKSFADAMAAVQNGKNDRANSEVEDAKQALDRCSYS